MKTPIEWTDATWNPVRGCARVSPGCEHCYAERVAHRFSGPAGGYEGLTVLGRKGPRWVGRARFVPGKLGEPLRWRKPRRIFVNSMSDLFHEDVTDRAIAAVFGVMAATPQHTYQILTKRPERARDWFQWVEESRTHEQGPDFTVQQLAWEMLGSRFPLHPIKGTIKARPWPLLNVWLGASCEDQPRANERVNILRHCPAALHFLSLEPLLGPITLDDRWLEWLPLGPDENDEAHLLPPIRWVIVGGESGPDARYCEIDWIKSILAQCSAARVPCFVKQLGARTMWTHDLEALRRGQFEPAPRLRHKKGGNPAEWPSDLRVRQWPEVRG